MPPSSGCRLEPPERIVARTVDGGAGHRWAAVVTDEDDESVLVEAGVGKFFTYSADGVVQSEHHRVVSPALFVGDAGKLCEPIVGGVHWGVDRVEGQVEEERLRFVPFDERDRLAPEGVGQCNPSP